MRFALLLFFIVNLAFAQTNTTCGLFDGIKDICVRLSCEEGESIEDGCIPLPSGYLPDYFSTATLQVGIDPNQNYVLRLIINAYKECLMPLFYLDLYSVNTLTRSSLIYDNGTHIEGYVSNIRMTPILANLTKHLDLECYVDLIPNVTIPITGNICYINIESVPVNMFDLFSMFYDILLQFDYDLADQYNHRNITPVLIPLVQSYNKNFTTEFKLNSTWGCEGFPFTKRDGILTSSPSILLFIMGLFILFFFN
ncbi:hypothetical protein WA158_001484 [Blastocystis sp. Blastoise]